MARARRSRLTIPASFHLNHAAATACVSKLSRQSRKRMHASTFAVPETRSYPIPDAYHARLALSALMRVHGRHGADPNAARKVLAAVRQKFPIVYRSESMLVFKIKSAHHVR